MENEILKELVLYNPVNNKIRLGRKEDGGYVLIDGYDYDCFISVGIADEMSFEIDFAKYRPDVHSFALDVAINRPAELPANIDFVKKLVGFEDNEKMTTLKEYTEGYNDIFIKVDIEGAEWRWIESFADYFKKVKQITFEAHAMFPHTLSDLLKRAHCQGLPLDAFRDHVLKALRILNETHYLVHVYENNRGPFINIGGTEYPSFSILTFIRKDCEVDGLNTKSLPIDGIDFPCYSSYPNHNMNVWPFVA